MVTTTLKQTTTLDQLQPGVKGTIVSIDGIDGVSTRLREMGFIPGASIRAMCPAPLGDPLTCQVLGCRIALRSGEARRICIQPEG